jgi:hypothetical protein
MAVEWKRLKEIPIFATRLSVGVLISPPYVDGVPGPKSSIRMIRIFGAPSARCFVSTRFLYTESSIVNPAVEADGAGGKGSTSCAPAMCANVPPSMRLATVRMAFRFMFISNESFGAEASSIQ